MRPTTPIPNGCSFTLLSCRVNSPSLQRLASPNRTAPQMYKSPDSKKISLKQARSPGGHYQFYNSLESSISESDSSFKENGRFSRFSEVVCVNNSSQIDFVLRQRNMQRIVSPINKVEHIGTVHETIERRRSPMGNKLTDLERLEIMEVSNESHSNNMTNQHKRTNLNGNNQIQDREALTVRLCPTSQRASRINLARRVITEENKQNKPSIQPALIYKSELFASPGKQIYLRYLSPTKESQLQRLKQLGHSDLALRETYPSMGEMNSFAMEKSPRQDKQMNYFHKQKSKMISPSNYSKILSPSLANFSKKVDISVVDKMEWSNCSGQGNQYECEKDNRFGKLFGLTTLKSLPLKEDV